MVESAPTPPEAAQNYTTKIVEGMHGHFLAIWQCPYPVPTIKLELKTAFERIGVQIGLNKQILIGDARFDEIVWIDNSIANDVILKFLQNEDLRSAVLVLFSNGYDRIEFADTSFKLIKKHNYPSKAQIEEIEPVVNSLLAGVPHIPHDEKIKRPNAWTSKVVVAILLLSALSLILSATIQNAYQPLDSTGWRELILVPVSLIILGRFLKGHPNSFGALCFSIPFVIAIHLMLGYTLIAGLNGFLDTSPVVVHSTTVTKKNITTDLHGMSYYHVRGASWRAGETEVELKVSSSFYNAKSVGAPLVITTRSGALGLEWIVNYR